MRIDIPIGSYVPTFYLQKTSSSPCSLPEIERDKEDALDAWPTVLIQPFQNFSEGTGPRFIAEGFVAELAIELSRYQDLRILMKPPGQGGASVEEPQSRFLIDGNVRCGPNDFKLAVQLFDQKTHRQVWGDVFHCDMNPDNLMAFQRGVSQLIAAKIAQEQGFTAQTLALESQNKPPAEMAPMKPF